VPGLLGPEAKTPQCGRVSGDASTNPGGIGCSVADLCAQGWHVCLNADEVARRSPTDCESAYPVGHGDLFFVVRGGASPLGICSADPTAANDLHGCGNIGQPEAQTCQPLERRMGFADCLTSAGIWQCGQASDHLREAALVVKRNAFLGGVLCCRE
jgi:hypothetical protein